MVAGAEKEGLIFEEFETNGNVPPESWELTFEFAADDIIGDTDLTVPSLGLPRLFVLTSSRTCSASESIINSLLGIDIDVIRIGTATCGKPYGFTPAENCGTGYHWINFRGVNAKGEADFEDGFAPHCQAAEDFNHQLGDPEEILLKTALVHRISGACPPAEEEGDRTSVSSVESSSGEAISKPPRFSGRIAGSGIPASN